MALYAGRSILLLSAVALACCLRAAAAQDILRTPEQRAALRETVLQAQAGARAVAAQASDLDPCKPRYPKEAQDELTVMARCDRVTHALFDPESVRGGLSPVKAADLCLLRGKAAGREYYLLQGRLTVELWPPEPDYANPADTKEAQARQPAPRKPVLVDLEPFLKAPLEATHNEETRDPDEPGGVRQERAQASEISTPNGRQVELDYTDSVVPQFDGRHDSPTPTRKRALFDAASNTLVYSFSHPEGSFRAKLGCK